MDQQTHKKILNSSSEKHYDLPHWIRNFFVENPNAYQEIQISSESEYLHNRIFGLGRSKQKGQAFLVYQANFDDKVQKSSIDYTRSMLESIWGFNFEYIVHPTQKKTILFYCFALYDVAKYSTLLSLDIAQAVYQTDLFLEKLIAESQRGNDPILPPFPDVFRLPYIKTDLLPDQPGFFTQNIPFKKSVASRLTELDFAETQSASSFYINLNPNLFLKNLTDAYLIYKTADYPQILAFEKIIHRDVFLKEVIVFRGGCCYLWNIEMLSSLKLQSRSDFDDQHLDVKDISNLSLTKIFWYLQTFYNLNISVEQIQSTLVDIALEKSKAPTILGQIGEDKIDKATQLLTVYFSMPNGIVESFQDGLESMNSEGGINFRATQKFLVQFGQLAFLRDDFKMSGLLKSYAFKLNGDDIHIIQKSKKWVFTKNGSVWSSNPFQGRDCLDDIEIFSRDVLKSLEKPKGKDKE